jgi:LPXTG-site transpeptidase (sortase) family protein
MLMTLAERKYFIIRTAGNFLLLFAIFGVFSTFGPALYFETQFRIIQARGITYRIAEAETITEVVKSKENNQPSFGDLLTGATEQEIVPPDADFSIVIPKIGASAKVFPNIDPSREDAFLPVLQQGVAHAQGTVFPGLAGNIYLFAHSTDNFWNAGRYNAIFYLLKDLKEGDEIAVFFQGERYNYFVTQTRVVDSSDVSFITQANTGNEQLILQTCWPPGTTWKRLLVFARPRSTDTIFKTN